MADQARETQSGQIRFGGRDDSNPSPFSPRLARHAPPLTTLALSVVPSPRQIHRMSTRHPCSPKLETDGLIYFPRLCDKVRMMQDDQLEEDYHANLGGGMDLWICQFLGVDYDALAEVIRNGAKDSEALAWARKNGTERPDFEAAWWNAYMWTRGFRDDLSERLASRIEESGFGGRTDILTFMDYIDADEGRI